MLVDGDDVLCARDLQHVDDGRARCAGAVLDDLDVLDALADDLQRVEHARQHNDGRAVLVIVKDGDVEVMLQLSLDLEALRAADVLQIDATERRSDGLDRRDNFLFCLGVQADGECVDAAELLEQDALTFHNGQAGFRGRCSPDPARRCRW